MLTLAALAIGVSVSAPAHAEPNVEFDDNGAKAAVQTQRNYKPAPGVTKFGDTPAPPASTDHTKVRSATISSVNVKSDKPKKDIQVKTEVCNDMSLTQCSSARAGCITESGNPDYYDAPTITWISVNNGGWRYSGLSCGTPDSVALPGQPKKGGGGAGEPVTVRVQAPPTPSFGQIQQAFRELPFSKPSPSIEPVGLRTLKNLPTYYAVTWPDDDGLQPGEVSKKVQLLSWTVEFKVAAQDYRYNYGDGSTSAWTSSTGGAYPDGDITHTYEHADMVDVSVDARLTGQYRVNGGEWRDIATTADLQDEPSSTLEVLGTKTRLVHH